MKQIIKTYFKHFILLLILTTISCKEDVIENNLEETSSEEHIISTKHLTIDHLPHLEGIIAGISVNTTSRTANTTFGDLNLSDIIEFVNEDGKETYTFKIENSTNIETPLEFENLHLIKLDDGYLAYILKWVPDYEWYRNNDFSFITHYFTGVQKHYDLDYNLLQENEFINGQPLNSSTSGRSSSTQNSSREEYNLECTDDIVSLCNFSGSDNCGGDICGYGLSTACYLSGGGGGNNNGGDDTSSGNPTSGGGTHISGGSSGSGNTSGSGGYVPGGSGTVVISDPTNADYLSYSLGITLTEEQIAWANNDLNRTEYNQLMDYFGSCNVVASERNSIDCADLSDFGALALEALMEGDEVDFEHNIIYKDWEDFPCQKEIINNLINTSSPFMDVIKNTFDVDENVNIEFEAGFAGGGAGAGPIVYVNPDTGATTINIAVTDDLLNNASDLGLVMAITHELVHAHLIQLYHDGTLLAANSEFNTLYNSFLEFYKDSSQVTYTALADELHNAMVDFINKMANSIYNYATSNNIEDVSADFATKLSWGSLHSTTAFETILSNDEQIENNNIYVTEENNLSGALGSASTPCD